ncbi:MAG: AAA-like domain-containing protein [Bacteroidales bacterium]|nr:AAA-like domain-containing protein [Bacteroidales bacterium]
MKQLDNPFVTQGYAGSRYFCDRESESTDLIEALRSGRNVSLISPRRMGKSGLIHHAFSQVAHQSPEVKCFYLDIFHTRCLNDFIQTLANAVFGAFDSKAERFWHTIVSALSHCRPVLSADSLTGAPTLILDIAPENEQRTLQDIFHYLNSSGQRVYMAIDEFQQVAEYPEKGVEALLRSYIQQSPSLSFIFAGSKKHLMQQMFTMPQRPFYQSTQTLSLKEIPRESYIEFAQKSLKPYGKEITADAFDFVYDSVQGHTYYIQYWLSKAFDTKAAVIDLSTAKLTLDKILKEEDDNFFAYTSLLTASQTKVLRAIAREGRMSTPYSIEIVKKYDLPSTSTIRSAIKSLIDKEFLLDDRGVLSVYNRFFMLWLAR